MRGGPNSSVPYNDPHDDAMEFNYQDLMSDHNPTLADLETPENAPTPQLEFDDEDYDSDYDPTFQNLMRRLRENEASRRSSSLPPQQLSGNEHHGGGSQFDHNLSNQSGGLLQPLQNQLQSLSTQGGSTSGGGGLLSPRQFENVSGTGGGSLHHNQFPLDSLNAGSESFLPQLQPSPNQLQQNQVSSETSNDGNQIVHNFNPQSGSGGRLLPIQFPFQRTNDHLGLFLTRRGSNSNSTGRMPSQIGGSNANSQGAGPSNRRHPTRTGRKKKWDISQCAPCQVIREVNHTTGSISTKLEFHGGLLYIDHLVCTTYEENTEPKHEMFPFEDLTLESVKIFALSYMEVRRDEGFIMVDDRFSEFYGALCVELSRRASSSFVLDLQPVSLSDSGSRPRAVRASGSGRARGNAGRQGRARGRVRGRGRRN